MAETHSGRFLRLGVNVDHVATLRNARGGATPDPVRAALLAEAAGADGITAHLREDRRHITDDDIARLQGELDLPLNLEMAATPDMLTVAVNTRPAACCLVPERRAEVTTEGGLDVAGQRDILHAYVGELAAAGVKVSLFIDPEPAQVAAARAIDAPAVELHTGAYVNARDGAARERELDRLKAAAQEAQRVGLACHAGHGLTFDTVGKVAAIANMEEVNIGHFLIGEALFTGLDEAIATMRQRMDQARHVAGLAP